MRFKIKVKEISKALCRFDYEGETMESMIELEGEPVEEVYTMEEFHTLPTEGMEKMFSKEKPKKLNNYADYQILIEKLDNGFLLTESWDEKGEMNYKSKKHFIQYAEELGNFIKEKFEK